jgi:hypothetical protein
MYLRTDLVCSFVLSLFNIASTREVINKGDPFDGSFSGPSMNEVEVRPAAVFAVDEIGKSLKENY